jgi:hypothetical protein
LRLVQLDGQRVTSSFSEGLDRRGIDEEAQEAPAEVHSDRAGEGDEEEGQALIYFGHPVEALTWLALIGYAGAAATAVCLVVWILTH